MKSTLRWVNDVMFVGQADSGHSVVIDGPADAGGRNAGFRPMELVLTGLGGCTAFDVVSILKKSRQQVSDCVVQLDAKRADDIPQVFTHIHIHFIVSGHDLSVAAVERAIKLSAEKYCSASLMLQSTVEITHDFEITPAAPGD